jgi:cellulose synthase/poly-beta-1,6-N-acetylglucosamine synthase-like glycosyltransferase
MDWQPGFWSLTSMTIGLFAANMINFGLGTLALALLIPAAMLLLECLAALLLPLPFQIAKVSWDQIRAAVLVPAHNEAAVIEPTLKNLIAQIKPSDRIIVVADNCHDQTAAIARSLGATVIERHDLEHRGKGYALDFGLRYLQTEPPDVVVMVDADCELSEGTLATLVKQTMASSLPTQATYLLEKPPQPSPKDLISAFAFKVKNLVRPLGLARLGLPCLLTGTGMAFPWQVLQSIDLASGHIVEDMKLGIDLAIAGYPPQFCADANVVSRLPQDQQVAEGQRTRWEHGHMQVMKKYIPELLRAAISQRRSDLLMIAFDLCVPPLALLVLIYVGTTTLSLAAALLTASWVSLFPVTVVGLFVFLAILIAWTRFGRSELPLLNLLAIPLYILWKVPLYLKFVIRPLSAWNSTQRDIPEANK